MKHDNTFELAIAAYLEHVRQNWNNRLSTTS
jgi:hypothetical protein